MLAFRLILWNCKSVAAKSQMSGTDITSVTDDLKISGFDLA